MIGENEQFKPFTSPEVEVHSLPKLKERIESTLAEIKDRYDKLLDVREKLEMRIQEEEEEGKKIGSGNVLDTITDLRVNLSKIDDKLSSGEDLMLEANDKLIELSERLHDAEEKAMELNRNN